MLILCSNGKIILKTFILSQSYTEIGNTIGSGAVWALRELFWNSEICDLYKLNEKIYVYKNK